MKKYLFLIASIFTILTSNTAQANEGFYVGALGGANWADTHHVKSNTGYGVVGSLGYKFCSGLRVEGEVGYRRNCVEKVKFEGLYFNTHGHLSTVSYLANVLYDIPLDCFCIKPYLGAGIGYARADRKFIVQDFAFDERHRNKGFAWNLIAGLAYPICDCIDLDLQYRYFHTRKHISHNSLYAGLRLSF